MFALLRLAGVAGDVGLEAAVAAQRQSEIDARSEQQDPEGNERDERRHAVADQGMGLGELAAVHIVAQADGFAPLALPGVEDRVLHLPRAFVSGIRLFAAARPGEHQAPVAVHLVDFRGVHAEIALSLADHRNQRVAVEDTPVVVAPDAFPKISQFIEIGFVAQQILPFGVQHTLAELFEMLFGQVVAPGVERAADQLPEGIHIAVVPVEPGAAVQPVLGGVIAVEQVDVIRGELHLFVVAFGLVVGAAEHVVDEAAEIVPDDRAGHLAGEFESLFPELGLGNEGVPYPFFVVTDRHAGVSLQQEPLHPVENVVRMCRVVVAPLADGMGQPERLFLVVFAAQAVESVAHFGESVHPLFGGSGGQFAQFRDIVTKRVFFFGIRGVLCDDGYGGHGHGVGVADSCGFAEKLDRIDQVEVRIFVDVLQVEQQLHPFLGGRGVCEPLLQTVRQLTLRPGARGRAQQDAYHEEYVPKKGHLLGRRFCGG